MFVFALPAIWWLATLHCRLEASVGGNFFRCAAIGTSADAGRISFSAEAGRGDAGNDSRGADAHACDGDGCEVVESGNYRPAPAAVQVAAPLLVAHDEFGAFPLSLALTFSSIAGPRSAFLAESESERALRWLSEWYFARRAAPFSRAPSATIA
jgi:hypothetical protein